MSAVEWGVKRRCGTCEAPFYDLLRNPIRCPKCGTVFRVEAASARSPSAARSLRARSARVNGDASRSGPAPRAEVLDPVRIDADKARADEEADRDEADEDADEAEPDSADVTGDDDQAGGDEAPRDG